MPAPQGHKREGDGTPIYEVDHHQPGSKIQSIYRAQINIAQDSKM